MEGDGEFAGASVPRVRRRRSSGGAEGGTMPNQGEEEAKSSSSSKPSSEATDEELVSDDVGSVPFALSPSVSPGRRIDRMATLVKRNSRRKRKRRPSDFCARVMSHNVAPVSPRKGDIRQLRIDKAGGHNIAPERARDEKVLSGYSATQQLAIRELIKMGFPQSSVVAALELTDFVKEYAMEWLLSKELQLHIMLEKPPTYVENRVNVVINNQNAIHEPRAAEPSRPPKLSTPPRSPNNRNDGFPRRRHHSPSRKKKKRAKRRNFSSSNQSPRRGSRQNSLASTVFSDPRESLARIEVDQLKSEVERRLDDSERKLKEKELDFALAQSELTERVHEAALIKRLQEAEIKVARLHQADRRLSLSQQHKKGLLDQLKKAQEQNGRLKEEVERLQGELQQTGALQRKTRNDLDDKIVRLENRLHESVHPEICDALQSTIQSLQAEISKHKAEKLDLAMRVKELSTSLKAAEDSRDDLKQQLNLQETASTPKGETAAARSDAGDDFVPNARELELEWDNRIHDAEKKLKKLQEALKSSEERRMEVERKLAQTQGSKRQSSPRRRMGRPPKKKVPPDLPGGLDPYPGGPIV